LSPSAQRLIRYGALAVVAVVLVAGAVLYLFDRPTADTIAASEPATRQARPAASANTDDDLQTPSEAATDRAMRLVGEGRRLADDGKFDEAKAKLDQAEKVVPGLSETADTRRRIAEMATPEGQFALQVARARNAIGSDDDAAAEKALAEAERLKPQAPELAELRQAMQAAQQKETKRSGHVAELLGNMREAIARKDIAGADRAFNEAARLDILDPALDKARVELAHAHEAAREKN